VYVACRVCWSASNAFQCSQCVVWGHVQCTSRAVCAGLRRMRSSVHSVSCGGTYSVHRVPCVLVCVECIPVFTVCHAGARTVYVACRVCWSASNAFQCSQCVMRGHVQCTSRAVCAGSFDAAFGLLFAVVFVCCNFLCATVWKLLQTAELTRYLHYIAVLRGIGCEL